MMFTKGGNGKIQAWIMLCLGASLAVTGCSSESTDSSNVKTAGIYADLSVDADSSSNAVVEAALKVGGSSSNTYLELVSGDVLTASNGIHTQTMTRIGSGNWVRYRATLPDTPLNSDSQFTISLTRAADTDAPSSSVSLAPVISITQPPVDFISSYSRSADDLLISWDPISSGESTRLTIEGSCIQQFQWPVTGLSSFTVQAGNLHGWSSLSGADTGCSATIRLERIRYGAVDPAYSEGGNLVSTRMAERAIFTYP